MTEKKKSQKETENMHYKRKIIKGLLSKTVQTMSYQNDIIKVLKKVNLGFGK